MAPHICTQVREISTLSEQNKNTMKKLEDIDTKLDRIMSMFGELDDRYDKRYASKSVEAGLVWALKIVIGSVFVSLLAVIRLWTK